MANVVAGQADELQARRDRQARPLPPAMIGCAAAERVEFDAGDDARAAREFCVIGAAHLFAVHQAQQQGSAFVMDEGRKAFAVDDEASSNERLHSEEICQAVSVGSIGPAAECGVERLADFRLGMRRLRLDASPDERADPGFRPCRGMPVVRGEIARPARERLARGELRRDRERHIAHSPAAPPAGRAVIAEGAGRNARRRPGQAETAKSASDEGGGSGDHLLFFLD